MTEPGSTGTRTATQPPGRRLLELLPGRRARTRATTGSGRAADVGDRGRGRRRGRRLVVGEGLRRGRRLPHRPRRDARRPSPAGDPPRAVRGPLACHDDRAGPPVSRVARHPRRLRLPPARLRRPGLGARDGAEAGVDAPLCRAPSSSASPPPAGFDGFYTYDFMDYGGTKFVRLCAQAHAEHLLCGPSVGPGYDGRRGRASPALASRGRTGHVRPALAGRDPRPARHRHDHELQRVGGRDADRAGGGAGAATSSYDGAWGLHGKAAQMAYLTRTAYWSAGSIPSAE